jgi:hypothetical protein
MDRPSFSKSHPAGPSGGSIKYLIQTLTLGGLNFILVMEFEKDSNREW